MKLKINVTKDDIRNGIPSMTTACPIARAFKRVKILNVRVHNTSYKVKDLTYRLPKKAQRFINDFDNGYFVEPFSFNVGIRKP